jgi:hypothetical protein
MERADTARKTTKISPSTFSLSSIHLEDKVKLYTQPANPPDLNILDLGLFNAIQAAYYRMSPRNQVQLITMVKQTYERFAVNESYQRSVAISHVLLQ